MLDIIKIPTESLRERSEELDPDFILSDDIQNLIKEMILTMHEDDGVGLAAPQVGKNIRLCVIGKEVMKNVFTTSQHTPFDINKDLILVNPVWIKTSRKKLWDVEGCLSVPKTFGKVRRYKNIHVKSLNEKGESIEFDTHDFFARVIQHEVDHLDGILFIDKAKGIYTTE